MKKRANKKNGSCGRGGSSRNSCGGVNGVIGYCSGCGSSCGCGGGEVYVGV